MKSFATSGVDLNRFATADSKRTQLALEAEKQTKQVVCSKLNLDQPLQLKQRKHKSDYRKESAILNSKVEQAKRKKSQKQQNALWDHIMFWLVFKFQMLSYATFYRISLYNAY